MKSKGWGHLILFKRLTHLIEQKRDENSAIFNATEAVIAVLKSNRWIPNMIAILEATPNGKMEMKLILNGTHLMLFTINRIFNFVLKLLFI